MISIGPTGKLIQGSLFDVNRKSFERALKRFDERLELRWNEKKRGGLGMWEVWQRPEHKSFWHVGDFNGKRIMALEYNYYFACHVADLPYLDYERLARWNKYDLFKMVPRKSGETDAQWMERVHAEMEYRERKHEEEVNKKAAENQRYMVREHKREIREIKEAILSGVNPAQIIARMK